MPVVTVGGEKKKVACGPCIRGHRSSKCAHKDRVLIEVRKPGRPLGTCPHPAGSCGCERVVINYMIPKGKTLKSLRVEYAAKPSLKDRTTPSLPQGLSPASAASSRVQKSSVVSRSVANLPQATVDKVLSGDTSALAVLSQYPPEPISSSSDTSSVPASASSSASATPRIDAVQSGPDLKSISQFEDSSVVKTTQHIAPQSRQILPATDQRRSVDAPADLPSQSKSCCCSQPAEASNNDAPSLTQTDPVSSGADMRSDTTARHNSLPELASSTDGFAHQTMNYDFAGPDLTSADFPSFEFDIGCPGNHPPASSISQRMMEPEAVHCDCGDSCQCFACMTHPRNRTTVDYVRYHNELLSQASYLHTPYGPPPILQSQRPMYDTPQHYNIQASPISPHPLASHMMPQPQHSTFAPSHAVQWAVPQPQVSAANMVPHTPVSELESLHFPLYADTFSPLMTSESGHMSTHAFSNASNIPTFPTPSADLSLQMTPQQTHRTIPTPLPGTLFDPDSPRDEDASTLSPSSFLLQQFTVPGCDDLTGTCQCGEGCSCPGCVTHSGHGNKASGLVDQISSEEAQSLVEVKTEKKSCCS